MSRKSPYLTLAGAAILFAVMVAVEAAAASDDDAPDHSEYGNSAPPMHPTREGQPLTSLTPFSSGQPVVAGSTVAVRQATS